MCNATFNIPIIGYHDKCCNPFQVCTTQSYHFINTRCCMCKSLNYLLTAACVVDSCCRYMSDAFLPLFMLVFHYWYVLLLYTVWNVFCPLINKRFILLCNSITYTLCSCLEIEKINKINMSMT